MSSKNIYWVSLGGNNKTHAGGNANLVFACEDNSEDNGKKSNLSFSDSILIDFGNCYHGPDVCLSKSVIPDLDFLFPENTSEAPPIPKAILLTHDHADHLEGVVHALLRGRKLPPIVASAFTLSILKTRLEKLGYTQEFESIPVKPYETYDIGGWTVKPFSVSHSTAECLGFFLEKDGKTIMHLGDFKNDSTVLLGPQTDYEFLKLLHQEKGVDAILLDAIYGGRDISVEDEEIRDNLRCLFAKNDGKRLIFGFYGGYLEMAANIMAVAAEKGYAVVIAGEILEKRLEAFARVREPIKEFLQKQLGFDVPVYLEGNEALQHIDKNKTVILSDLMPTDEKSFLGRLLQNQDMISEVLDTNDSIYVTNTVIKFGHAKDFPDFAEKLKKQGIQASYKYSGRFVDVAGHASWAGVKRILDVTQPKTAVFIYGRERDLTETFNRASVFGEMNRLNPANGDVYQIAPFKSEPVLRWGEKWMEVRYLLSDCTQKPHYRLKIDYKP